MSSFTTMNYVSPVGLIPGYNSTQIGLPPGASFMDLMFHHILTNGWSGISFLTLFHFYAYNSVGRFKELTEYVNAKITIYGKMLLDKLYEWAMSFVNKFYEWIILSIGKIWVSSSKKVISWCFSTDKDQKSVKKLEIKQPTIEYPSFMYEINTENIIDMMAISHFLLSMRNRISLTNNAFRKDSNREIATEHLSVPTTVNWNWQNSEGVLIDIQLKQSVDWKLIYETNVQRENLKNYFLVKATKNLNINASAFYVIIEKWATDMKWILPNHPDITILYTSATNGQFHIQSSVVCQGLVRNFINMLYLTDNLALANKFFRFLGSKDTFVFNCTTYTNTTPVPVGMFSEGEDKKTWETAFHSAHVSYMKHFHFEYLQLIISKMRTDCIGVFDLPESLNIQLSFTDRSMKMTSHELSISGHQWMAKQINEYYNEQNMRVDNRISIYKLSISYKVERKKNLIRNILNG